MPNAVNFEKRNEHGEYHTKDGRFYVARQADEVPCIDPHPCQISAEHRTAIREALARRNFSVHEVIRYERPVDSHGHRPDTEAIYAVREGKKGYFCPGDELHIQWHWYVWDKERDDYAGGIGVHEFDTKKEAVQWMSEKFYGVKSESTKRFEAALAERESTWIQPGETDPNIEPYEMGV